MSSEKKQGHDVLFYVRAEVGLTAGPTVFGPFTSMSEAEQCVLVLAGRRCVESAVIQPIYSSGNRNTQDDVAAFLEQIGAITHAEGYDIRRRPQPPENVETRDGSPTPRKTDA